MCRDTVQSDDECVDDESDDACYCMKNDTEYCTTCKLDRTAHVLTEEIYDNGELVSFRRRFIIPDN